MDLEEEVSNKTGFSWRDLNGKDRWESFSPTFGSLTIVGAPTYTGRLRVIGRKCEFQVQFLAATSIASVAGTDYLTLPITANTQSLTGGATMQNLATNVAVGTCVITVSTNACYLPAQAASGSLFGLTGSYEV